VHENSILIIGAPTVIDRSQVDDVRRLRDELVDRVLDAERLVQFASHRVERAVRRLVDGRAARRGVVTQPEPRISLVTRPTGSLVLS